MISSNKIKQLFDEIDGLLGGRFLGSTSELGLRSWLCPDRTDPPRLPVPKPLCPGPHGGPYKGREGAGGWRSEERGSTSPESQRTMIGRRDRRGEPREQRTELGAFSSDHEHHPQRREARCRVHLPMPWLLTGIACRGIQRAAAGCGQVCRADMLHASLPCPDGRTVRLSRGCKGGAVQFSSRLSMQWWPSE